MSENTDEFEYAELSESGSDEIDISDSAIESDGSSSDGRDLSSIDQSTEGICNDADSFCGIKDKLYPDRRSMGYPFDREPRQGVTSLQAFLTPNMRVQDVAIKFTNKIMRRKQSN
ncbi:hypothetical protein NQ318_008425 [Aromia moschata]|uniref:Hemocyanin C-terminal domain-containing protein n=1 Tax=Aromia moschata TaxID=1265417 RepID=A0AAV8YB65_9CUCU|nr:hypothetical protein NQ318_008425 [Aromia moschata]